MYTSPIDTFQAPSIDALRPFASPMEAVADDRAPSFSTILSRFTHGSDQGSPEDKARFAAEEFVATTLITPILKQLREMNQASGPFAPGRYEKTFGALFDGEIASRIVRASHFPLVDRLARDLLRQSSDASSAPDDASIPINAESTAP